MKAMMRKTFAAPRMPEEADGNPIIVRYDWENTPKPNRILIMKTLII